MRQLDGFALKFRDRLLKFGRNERNRVRLEQLDNSLPSVSVFRFPTSWQRLPVAEIPSGVPESDLYGGTASAETGTPWGCTFVRSGAFVTLRFTSELRQERHHLADSGVCSSSDPSYLFGNCLLNSSAWQSCNLMQWQSNRHPLSVHIELLRFSLSSRCFWKCLMAALLPCWLTL